MDIDPALRRRGAAASFSPRLAGTDTLLLGSHFPPPTAGVVPEGSGYRLDEEPARRGPTAS